MPIYFRLSPELGDGSRTTIVDDIELVLEYVKEWTEEAQRWEGESCSIDTVEMTKKEYENLDEI